MNHLARTRVKICCIQNAEEARMAVAAGADALGLVSEMPSGPGVIDEQTIIEVARTVPPAVTSVLLTSQRSSEQIISQQRRCRVRALQLCDRINLGTHDDIRQACPGVGIIQVIHVNGREAIDEARQVADCVDAILLDSGRFDGSNRELGGTGRRHDWQVSRQIRDSVPVPVFLAGGLNPKNVSEAIATVQPFAVDVCSGLRIDGQLDPDLLVRFMSVVRGAG